MTVLEAMNLLGLSQRLDGRAALALALARALEQSPRQRELLEEAGRCLSVDLDAQASVDSRQTRIERSSTREILLFDENRDALMFGDEAPELPVAFRAPSIDDSQWMGDDSVILEGETAPTSEASSPALSETSAAAISEIPDHTAAQTQDDVPPAETVSGEWQLMLESLEAEGLIKPEEGFSDALSAQMHALSDTHPERLADNSVLFEAAPLEAAPLEAAPLETVTLETVTLEASNPMLEARAPASPAYGAALLETPLFTTPLFAAPMSAEAQTAPSSQSLSNLETPLFAALPIDTSEHVKAITFDDSLLISQGNSLAKDTDTGPHQVMPIKTLETLPHRKAPVATQLSVRAAAPQPSEPMKKQVTGRAGLTTDLELMRADRRSDVQRSTAQPVVPRTYRDVREPVTQVRRRRQPVAVWVLSVAALLSSAVFIAPNLAAQLRDALRTQAAAPAKPNAGSVPAKPRVKVVRPAAIKPVSSSLNANHSANNTVKPAAVQSTKPVSLAKTSSNPAVIRKPVVSPDARVNPPASVAKAAPRARVAAPKTTARVSATLSSAASLPPVTRPEGFASSGAASKPAVATKPNAAPAKPVVKPAPTPAPAPVSSIEYQPKPTPTQELPGGLSRQEFGRQFLNRKQFEVWQAQQQELRFGSFAEIPLETQVLESEAFREAVLIPMVRPTRPERP